VEQKPLQSLHVAIVVTDGFEQAELEEPQKALEEAGARTTIIAPKAGRVQGMKHDEKTIQVHATVALTDANARDFDALLLPGGALNADALRVEPKAQELVQKFDQAHKPIAVICHAPWLLISAGILKGRKITSYHTIADDIRNAGATWKDAEVVRERNIVSSRKPADIPAFNREMIAMFSEQKRKSQIA
jgi:protease I